MYHIKSDKRSQASAAEIVWGLQECLESKPLKSITVSDLHKVTGISRATFYRLFDTPEDVLIYQLDQMTEGAYQLYEQEKELPAAQLLEKTIATGLENHGFIRALVVNGRHDLLFRYTERNFHKLDTLKRIFPENMEQPERDYIIAHLSMAMVATQITWARNGHREQPKDLVRYLKRFTDVVSALIGEETETE